IICFLFVVVSVARGERNSSRPEWSFAIAGTAVFILYLFTGEADVEAGLTTLVDARLSSAPSGSTGASAMFWTPRTSSSPRRTSSKGLYAALAGLVGSNMKTRPTLARQPAVSDQFSPLMSWTIAEPGQVSSVGTTGPTPLPLRVGAKQRICSG